MVTDGWPLGRPQDRREGEFKLLPWFEKALEMVRDYENTMMKSMGVAPEFIDPDWLSPDIEGDVMTLTPSREYEDGHGNHLRVPSANVMVLLVIPRELCLGAQTAICKRLDGNGSPLKAMAPWVANAGIAAGIDPDERVVIATGWELS